MTQAIRELIEELKKMVAGGDVFTKSVEFHDEYCYEVMNEDEYEDEEDKGYVKLRCIIADFGADIWDKELRNAIARMMNTVYDDYNITYDVDNVIIADDRIYVNYRARRSYLGGLHVETRYGTTTLEKILEEFEKEKAKRVPKIEELEKKLTELIAEYFTTLS